MSVEQTSTIDGIGVEGDTRVVMLISDHLDWGEPNHMAKLKSKVEAYINAIHSNQTAEIIPNAMGKPHVIRLIHKNLPTDEAIRVLEIMAEQLGQIGIGFESALLPHDY